MERKIIHIDMDAFFASVELRENPSLRGRPVAVGYDGPRGVVSTASYEARRYGVHSALPMARAKRLCPELVIVPSNFPLYKQVSAQIHEIFHEYTPLVEPISLDEAFLDVTAYCTERGLLAIDVAREIKGKILEATRLTGSAGVSYCKFLAKIASDYRKPDGLTVIHPSQALDFIARLPIERFWGVGPKTAERFHRMGITNGLQLRELPLTLLTTRFGRAGRVYYDFARGIDERPVEAERIRKSVGCEETYPTDLHASADISQAIEALASDLSRRLRRASFAGRTLTLKVKYHDFTQITRSITHPDDTLIDAETDVVPLAHELLTHTEISPERPVRLLGLTVSNPPMALLEGVQLRLDV